MEAIGNKCPRGDNRERMCDLFCHGSSRRKHLRLPVCGRLKGSRYHLSLMQCFHRHQSHICKSPRRKCELSSQITTNKANIKPCLDAQPITILVRVIALTFTNAGHDIRHRTTIEYPHVSLIDTGLNPMFRTVESSWLIHECTVNLQATMSQIHCASGRSTYRQHWH